MDDWPNSSAEPSGQAAATSSMQPMGEAAGGMQPMAEAESPAAATQPAASGAPAGQQLEPGSNADPAAASQSSAGMAADLADVERRLDELVAQVAPDLRLATPVPPQLALAAARLPSAAADEPSGGMHVPASGSAAGAANQRGLGGANTAAGAGSAGGGGTHCAASSGSSSSSSRSEGGASGGGEDASSSSGEDYEPGAATRDGLDADGEPLSARKKKLRQFQRIREVRELPARRTGRKADSLTKYIQSLVLTHQTSLVYLPHYYSVLWSA